MINQRALSELNPKFIYPPEGGSAYGIVFDCPACSDHKIRIRFSNHPAAGERWEFSGNSFVDATITPSIDGTQEKVCKFHGHVTNGQVTW